MTLSERYHSVLDVFQKEQPNPETELIFDSDFQLLVAVILSAQCTDVRVNQVTKKLFALYPHPASMAKASEEDIFSIIRSISYPNNKTKYLIQTAKLLLEHHQGQVPKTLGELTQLPGVGRKTANVITSVLDKAPHMAVDTHVFRVSHRIGLVSKKETTPLAVEKKLTQYIPKHLIHKAHHWLILHGRYVCIARKPKCEICKIQKYCKSFTLV